MRVWAWCLAVSAGQPGSFAADAISALGTSASKQGQIQVDLALPFTEVLFAWAANPKVKVMARQLLFRLSIRLELVMGLEAQTSPPPTHERAISFGWTEEEKGRSTGQAPYICASYVASAATYIHRPLETAVMTDKGWCHALPLQATILGWPSGMAVIAHPQVPFTFSFPSQGDFT